VSPGELANNDLKVVHLLWERNFVEFFCRDTDSQAAISGSSFSTGNANGHQLFEQRLQEVGVDLSPKRARETVAKSRVVALEPAGLRSARHGRLWQRGQ
jgi:hypothetical protein